MPVSKMKMFAQLYKKEMRDLLPEIVVIIVLTIVMDGWIMLRTDGLSNAVVVIPIMISIGLAGFIPLLSSFKMISSEWSNNTVYLMMSLPVSGAMILGGKLLALFSQALIGVLAAGGAGALLFFHSFPDALQEISIHPDIYNRMFWLSIISIIGFLYLVTASFLSQLVGRLSRKRSGLLTLGTFLVILYLGQKLANLITYALTMDSMRFTAVQLDYYFNIINAYSIGYVLISALLFIAGVIIFDRKLEL